MISIVLRQDESFFSGISETQDNNESKDEPSEKETFFSIDPRKAFDDVFLRISMEETNRNDFEGESNNSLKNIGNNYEINRESLSVIQEQESMKNSSPEREIRLDNERKTEDEHDNSFNLGDILE